MARFPANPVQGEQYFDPSSGVTYTWDGAKWVTTQAPFNSGATGASGAQGFGAYAYARAEGQNGGTLVISDGLAFNRVQSGVYNYTLLDPIISGDYTVLATPIDTNGNQRGLATVGQFTPNGFQVRTTLTNTNGSESDCDHSVWVIANDATGPAGTSSAYASWLRVGNFGTEQQFLDSLSGDTGEQGATGPIGATGIDGSEGATGVRGEDGTSVQIKAALPDENDLNSIPVIDRALEDLYIILTTGVKFNAGDGAIWNGGTTVTLADWDNIGPIRGPVGPAGTTGATGPLGATGIQGVPSTDGGFFVISAERNGNAGTGNFFAFGNGASTNNSFPIPEDCEWTKLSVKSGSNYTGTGFFEVSAVVNGVVTANKVSVPCSAGLNQGTGNFSPPIQVLASDPANGGNPTLVAFQCTSGGKGGGVTVVSGTFVTRGARGATGPKGDVGPSGGATGSVGATGIQGPIGPIGLIGATGPKGDIGIGVQGATGPNGATGPQGIEGPVGTVVLGTVADIASLPPSANVGEGYVVTAEANDVYVWDGSGWNSIGPVQGPPGATGEQGILGATGNLSQNYFKTLYVNDNQVNASLNFTLYDVLNTTPEYESGGFTQLAGEVIVPTTGLYLVTSTVFLQLPAAANIQRSSVGMRFCIDDLDQPEIAAMGYIRDGSGHEESSIILTTVYSIAAGSRISPRFARLAAAGAVDLIGPQSSFTLSKIA